MFHSNLHAKISKIKQQMSKVSNRLRDGHSYFEFCFVILRFAF